MGKTYRKSSRSLIIIDGLIDSKVGVCDLVTQQVRPRMVIVVLRNDAVVLGSELILVRLRLGRQIGHPLLLNAG